MTRIDFYILKDGDVTDPDTVACKLTEKVYKLGHRVYLHTESEGQARHMDELLWTFRAGSFVPHGLYPGECDSAPVAIGHAADPEEHGDVLINLGSEVPAFFSRFQRVAEVVGGDPAQRDRARERFRFYRDRGYPLHTHEL